MAKVTELTDKELDDMILKHEKTLQLLMKEKGRRTGQTASVKLKVQPKTDSEGKESGQVQFVIEDEVIAKNEIAKKEDGADDETANMRLTRVLKLSKHELEQFNKAVEVTSKKKK